MTGTDLGISGAQAPVGSWVDHMSVPIARESPEWGARIQVASSDRHALLV